MSDSDYRLAKISDFPNVMSNNTGVVKGSQFKQTYINPTSATSYIISPNIKYFLNNITSNGLTITLSSPEENINNEYSFQFKWPSTVSSATITMPSNIKWTNNVTFSNKGTYDINIKYNPIISCYLGYFNFSGLEFTEIFTTKITKYSNLGSSAYILRGSLQVNTSSTGNTYITITNPLVRIETFSKYSSYYALGYVATNASGGQIWCFNETLGKFELVNLSAPLFQMHLSIISYTIQNVSGLNYNPYSWDDQTFYFTVSDPNTNIPTSKYVQCT